MAGGRNISRIHYGEIEAIEQLEVWRKVTDI